MISEAMINLVSKSSAIREMFEEGNRLAAQYGAENVFDFSLGNPNVAAPKEVNQAIKTIIEHEESTSYHGYMNNSGYENVRESVAASINRKQGTHFNQNNIIMTVGAAGGLNVIFKTLLNPDDEIVVFAPYFGEYKNYASNFNARFVVIPPDIPSFQPNLEAMKKAITKKTKIVLVNTPNNPTGVVYTEDTIKELAAILEQKQREFKNEIYIVSDEPYRELVYDGVIVPYLTKYYSNTIVGYSFSKSLSLPGERIGYLVIPNEAADFDSIVSGANVANRILGFVNAPSLLQKVIAKCVDVEIDLEYYDRNRKTLYGALTEYGFECVRPQGAFYLFMKSPIEDEKEFCQAAKKYNILIVPGSSFDCPGYVRMAYCVSYETIMNSLPGFKKLAQAYK
ncbi:pyridoxal phosphate-dependent aminotransferase [Anaerosacchariphilus polymeriproducens]|uniref:Aminotransferase n=1 Tax=Anaerosacchariphilus polymeriproducens TaxID=1812858 RepID=A0A371AWJ1_9FIRM|nr:pyridoxal phosphate-dependent aminotransferase [Anaerosacchariphilus polymeriproducens]RDU23954.1 pyridoxal phosphate-dependent aminotransferase [Anaerosacchariphilus polymeriproducens]